MADYQEEVESSRISSPPGEHNGQNHVIINGNNDHDDQVGYVGCSGGHNSLGRQTSIYSLTLDEFQQTMCEDSGKNFGSMNMDEFLNSIWIAEENQNQQQQQQQAQANDPNPVVISSGSGSGLSHSLKCANNKEIATGIEKQPSLCLSRQGSLSLSIPAPLSRKTVDEVWTRIQKEEEEQQMTGRSAQRQPTFGELTLEDFLVKAGVVREQEQHSCCGTITPHTQTGMVPPQHQQQHAQYGLAPQLGPGPSPSPSPCHIFGKLPIIPAYQGANNSAGVGSPGARGGNIGYGSGLRSDDGQPGGVRSGVGTVVMSAVGLCGAGGMEGIGRKRRMEGAVVEKAVERRQRRMIKNRESAARSRARKQAYTVELEAELNQLREENAKMKHILAEMKKKKRKQQNGEQKLSTHRNRNKDQGRYRDVRRSWSCNL